MTKSNNNCESIRKLYSAPVIRPVEYEDHKVVNACLSLFVGMMTDSEISQWFWFRDWKRG